ncbi:hypothetical protein DXI77_23020 [Salmonella enterica]|nr:hypothetical protein [Salmonella enterica]EAN8631415.1 hypothetical protein [Salmonella enterica subsp. enterica serovar Adelaide]EAP8921365.1 hypothetical protein [Salmonella enterica subsp. enterica serovar Adelaide]EBK5165671.1 hypothetical protein [Salmonella enterica]ECS3679987.1 hypothetical protein [Salmonella enterica subsp. enterica serovar Adelaide]
MMSLWDALRMNMMISYQELVRTFPNIPDTDTRRVMYMEGCDMLSKETMNEIRNTVKSPTDNMKIHRNGNHVTKIEFMEERNEITL